MPAVSMAGLLLKMRIGAAYSYARKDAAPDLDEEIEVAIREGAERPSICAFSILRDVYNIGVLGA